VRAAIADFSSHVQDPKAAILPMYISDGANQTVTQVVFYDGPTPPPGIFDNFTNIPSLSSDLKTGPFIGAVLGNGTPGLR